MTTNLIRVDPAAHRAWQGDQLLALGQREYAALALLVRHAGEPVTFDQLSRDVYQRPLDRRMRRTISQLVITIRAKLGDVDPPHHYIVNVRGLGYRMPERMVAQPQQRVEIDGVLYDVLHWDRQPDHGATTRWTLYARTAAVGA